MEYDYTHVTEVRHDRAARRVELVTNGRRVVLDGIDRVVMKSVAYVDERGVAHLNNGRASRSGDELAVGD